MNKSVAIENNVPAAGNKSWERRLWRWSVIIYAAAEGTYWFHEYFAIHCASCPAAYYIFQWFLNVVFTAFLWLTLYQLNYKRPWLVVVNVCVFLAYYFLWA